ncbi:MAG: RNA methyltransferase [bacterium]
MNDNIYIILVEPRTPGNIGSVARAMKNMGLSNLILINPVDYHVDETYWLGWGADDVINGAVCKDSLDEVLGEMTFVIGTTQRKRYFQRPISTPKEVVKQIFDLDIQKNKIAFLFGRENNGLSNQELSRCNILSTIPSRTQHPSLNLSQAVMIHCYEINQYHLEEKNPNYEWQLAEKQKVDKLYEHMTNTLVDLEFKPKTTMDNFVNLIRRVLDRALLEERDVRLLHKIFDVVDKYVQRH